MVRHLYPAADHDSIIDATTDDLLAWLTDREAGRPAPSEC